MKPVEQCKTLKALFAKRERWVKGHWTGFKNDKGHVTTMEGGDYVIPCFCLDGGLDQVYGKGTPEKTAAMKRIVKAIVKLGFRKRPVGEGLDGKIIYFNDSKRTKFEHIKAVIHAARV